MQNVSDLQTSATIQFLNGPLAGSTIQISKMNTRIGSDPHANDVVIVDPSILPQHATLIWKDEHMLIEQFDMCGLVTVNQRSVQQHVAVNNGDEIGLGVAQIRFRFAVQANSQISSVSTIDVKHTETTRYLCAAAHLDAKFRNYVMKYIVEEEHRAVGSSYGVDVIPVVKYCLAAKKREFTRNLILLLLLIITIITIVFLPSFLLFYLVAWVVVGVEKWISYYGNEAAGLAKGKFKPTNIQFPLDPKLEQKLQDISNTQDGNVIVASGYSPFVGAGNKVGAWSFAVDISKGKKEGEERLDPIEFQPGEIYAYLADAVKALHLEGLTIEDKLYVNGLAIRDDRRFLPDPYKRPYTQVKPTLMKEFMGRLSQSIRYYKCIRVTAWGGELVLSIFLRFCKTSKNLFSEANYFVLPPIQESYHRIDTVEPMFTFRKAGEVAGQTLLSALFLWVLSPLNILSSLFHQQAVSREHKETERAIKENPAFDYGANSSLREAASSSVYQRYFQLLDKEMYVKILEHQILESIIDFLDSKSIDTVDLKERQETILNNGVIVSGGTFSAENVAVGKRAQATFSGLAKSG